MWPKYTPVVHTGSHLFEPGQILCNKYATPYPDICFIVTSPYYRGSKCKYYFHVQHLSGKWKKSLTDTTELAFKNVTDYMLQYYPECFI